MGSRHGDGSEIVAQIYLSHADRIRGGEFPHVSLANLRDDEDALSQFTNRWGAWLAKGTPTRTKGVRFRNHLRKAWQGDKRALATLPFLHLTEFRVRGGRIVINPVHLWSTIVILFVRDHLAGKTAICANPNCPGPYFIRNRKTQKYCEVGPCVAQAQREQKRQWWKRNHGKGVKK